MMLLLIAVLQAAPGTVLRPDPTATQGETVVVVARDPKASKAALEECLRRRCPPREDIAKSIAYAEDQFVVGEYEDAWVTLRRSRKRNDRHAAALPDEVAGLRQFSADMASVLGDPDMARVGTIDSLSALKAAGPRDAAALEAKRLEIGDAFVRQSTLEAATDPFLRSKLDMAIATYDAVAARAAKAGISDVRGRAMLRGASLYAQLAGSNPKYRGEAHRRIAAIRAIPDAAMQRYRDAADVLVARMAYDDGDTKPIERLLADHPARTRQPMLVTAPRIDLRGQDTCGLSDMQGNDLQGQWIDYEFLITADGRVADIVERRRGEHAAGRWITLAQHSLEGRRYLPLELASGTLGIKRVERFVLVSDLGVRTGSRIAVACGVPSVLIVDLTATDTPRKS